MYSQLFRKFDERTRLMILAVLIGVYGDVTHADEFFDKLSVHGQKYSDFTSRPEIKTLSVEGQVSESNRRLLAITPDNKKTVYDYFYLSNMLFELDPDISYQYMQKAEKLAPKNPYILYERGIHEHRLGNYAVAQHYYEKTLNSEVAEKNHVLHAYLTHTYLMTGQAENALSAWKKVDFKNSHVSIEKAMYTVFSTNNQELKREALIAAIKQGEKFKLCDLYQMDANWEFDWWNYEPKQSYLEYDKKFAAGSFVNEAQEKVYFDLCSEGKDLSDEQYVKRLKDIGLLDKSAVLPKSSALLYEIARKLSSTKTMSSAELFNRFEPHLVTLSKQYPTDRAYFDLLAYLYVSTGQKDKLKEIDQYGWKTLKIEKYALSFILGDDPEPKVFTPVMKDALKEFPLSVTLNAMRLELAPEVKRDALMKLVAAQFANVKNHSAGAPRLGDYMASLQHELKNINNQL